MLSDLVQADALRLGGIELKRHLDEGLHSLLLVPQGAGVGLGVEYGQGQLLAVGVGGVVHQQEEGCLVGL